MVIFHIIVLVFLIIDKDIFKKIAYNGEKGEAYDNKSHRNRNRNKEIDTIEYKESLGISCFQGFFTVYSYKGKVVRVDDFLLRPP